MQAPKTIALVGATGSIGESTLDVVRRYPDRFRLSAVAANRSANALAAVIREFRPARAALAETKAIPALREALAEYDGDVEILGGPDGVDACVTESGADLCVSAASGSAGLLPTLAAIDAGLDVALANKEALVAGGALVMKRARARGVRLLPVDSEHSALFQCLRGEPLRSVRKLILTASGGPFRGWPAERLAKVTPADALDHPTWSMGRKVTIDSATLANKALETMEAHWLFDLPYDTIDVLVHPQSLVHGLVEFSDGSTLAHLAPADMRVPVAYALSYPDRLEGVTAPADLAALGTLCFEPPDRQAFPMLDLGTAAGRAGGTTPAAYSAANEAAVELFLQERIGFADIPRLVEASMKQASAIAEPELQDILAAEDAARRSVREAAGTAT